MHITGASTNIKRTMTPCVRNVNVRNRLLKFFTNPIKIYKLILTAKYKLVIPYKMRKMLESVNFAKQKYKPGGNRNTNI